MNGQFQPEKFSLKIMHDTSNFLPPYGHNINYTQHDILIVDQPTALVDLGGFISSMA